MAGPYDSMMPTDRDVQSFGESWRRIWGGGPARQAPPRMPPPGSLRSRTAPPLQAPPQPPQPPYQRPGWSQGPPPLAEQQPRLVPPALQDRYPREKFVPPPVYSPFSGVGSPQTPGPRAMKGWKKDLAEREKKHKKEMVKLRKEQKAAQKELAKLGKEMQRFEAQLSGEPGRLTPDPNARPMFGGMMDPPPPPMPRLVPPSAQGQYPIDPPPPPMARNLPQERLVPPSYQQRPQLPETVFQPPAPPASSRYQSVREGLMDTQKNRLNPWSPAGQYPFRSQYDKTTYPR